MKKMKLMEKIFLESKNWISPPKLCGLKSQSSCIFFLYHEFIIYRLTDEVIVGNDSDKIQMEMRMEDFFRKYTKVFFLIKCEKIRFSFSSLESKKTII